MSQRLSVLTRDAGPVCLMGTDGTVRYFLMLPENTNWGRGAGGAMQSRGKYYDNTDRKLQLVLTFEAGRGNLLTKLYNAMSLLYIIIVIV